MGPRTPTRDARVTASELVSFVKERVPKYRANQVPELIGRVPPIEFSHSAAGSPPERPALCGPPIGQDQDKPANAGVADLPTERRFHYPDHRGFPGKSCKSVVRAGRRAFPVATSH